MYDDLGYDEDPHLHCLESTQHSWVLDPSWIKAQQVVVHKSHMVTFTIPPNSVATPSPCILGIDPPLCLQLTFFVSIIDSLSALWAYLLASVNRMARIGTNKAPYTHLGTTQDRVEDGMR